VITGDVTQIDLPGDKRSGLVEAIEILTGVEGIGFMEFTEHDIVRHPLVQSIIRAYEARGRVANEGGRRGSGPGSAGPG
jgi:phosphate starvation-inducible PhoH-like protein